MGASTVACVPRPVLWSCTPEKGFPSFYSIPQMIPHVVHKEHSRSKTMDGYPRCVGRSPPTSNEVYTSPKGQLFSPLLSSTWLNHNVLHTFFTALLARLGVNLICMTKGRRGPQQPSTTMGYNALSYPTPAPTAPLC